MAQATPKDIKAVTDFLRKQKVGVMATSDLKGKVKSTAMVTVINQDLSINIITKKKTVKARNLLANPTVSLTYGLTPPFSVNLSGRAVQVKNEKEVNAVMDKWAGLVATLDGIWPPIFRLAKSEYAVFRIMPKEITALDLRRQTISGKEAPFIKIL